MLDAPLVASAAKHAVLTIQIIQMLRIMEYLGQPAMQLALPAPLLLITLVVLIKIVLRAKTRTTTRMMISVFA